MPSENVNQITRDEWRELGFFYDFDEKSSSWLLKASRTGLLKFRDMLIEYANNPRNDSLSEHDHYGPYMYLKLMTWDKPEITRHAICGRLADFKRLAEIIEKKLNICSVGDKFVVDAEYAENNEAVLGFEINEEDFDPASADLQLWSNDS